MLVRLLSVLREGWMKLFVVSIVLMCAVTQGSALSQDAASAKMAAAVIREWPAGVVTTENKPGEWAYEEGVLLDGMAAQWHATANNADFKYIKDAVDKYVTEDGMIRGYKSDAHSLDDIEMARAVLEVYRVTRQPKYAKAAKFVHDQLAIQPRTASGGYWHKQIYPNQMWLDGAYMAEPFRAAYAATFHEPGDFDDIAKQLLLMDAKMRDPKTGLLRHGWDESKQMKWADAATGLSPEIWARAMGWYAMALVDVLDWMPADHPQRAALVTALNRTAVAVRAYQDKKTGLWWQVMDKGGRPGNYTEASASSMFVYALAKGVRMGYLPQSYKANARFGWEGIQKAFVSTGPDGLMVLNGTVKVGGLGGTPYRSGTFDYYVDEKTIANDAKGVGAFLLAGSEMAQVSNEAPKM
jgi:unsaturated rhamnogalacturonyl hydrolase